MDETQTIAYLQDELSDEERAAFEQELERSDDLRELVARSRTVLEELAASREDAVRRQVESTILTLLEQGATALHYHREAERVVVRFRVEDDLVEQTDLEVSPSQWNAHLTSWKTLAQLNISERRVPQSGQFRLSHQGKGFTLRVTTLPTMHGEQLTARVFPHNDMDYRQSLSDLGLTDEQRKSLEAMIERPYGLLVITGPLGAGKTTLGYALLRDLVKKRGGRSHLISIEDPIESEVSGVAQCATNPPLGLTIPVLIRSGVLTSDADVVFVSNVTDADTVRLTGEMALTGHLVIACVTANTAQEALAHLESLGFSAAHRKSTLLGVVTTRLARRISPENVVTLTPSQEHLDFLGLTLADGPFYLGGGHDVDRGTGYKGRVGIYEVCEAQDGTLATTCTLQAAAREAIRSGDTTVEEAFRVLSV